MSTDDFADLNKQAEAFRRSQDDTRGLAWKNWGRRRSTAPRQGKMKVLKQMESKRAK